MGESRQRAAYPPIIDRPEFKSPLRHFVEGSITIGLWGLWIYWMLPLGTVFLWLVGYKMVYPALFAGDSFMQFLRVLKNGGLGMLIIFMIQLLWIFYNYQFIFKKKGERRKQKRAPDEGYLIRRFNVDPELLEKAKEASRLEVVLTDGWLVVIDPSPSLPIPAQDRTPQLAPPVRSI